MLTTGMSTYNCFHGTGGSEDTSEGNGGDVPGDEPKRKVEATRFADIKGQCEECE